MLSYPVEFTNLFTFKPHIPRVSHYVTELVASTAPVHRLPHHALADTDGRDAARCLCRVVFSLINETGQTADQRYLERFTTGTATKVIDGVFQHSMKNQADGSGLSR